MADNLIDPSKIESQNTTQSYLEEQELNESGSYRFITFQLLPSWFVSMVVHVILILALALMWIPKPQKPFYNVIADRAPPVEELEDFDVEEPMLVEKPVMENQLEMNTDPVPDSALEANSDVPFESINNSISPVDNLTDSVLNNISSNAIAADVGSFAAPTAGRSGARREMMVKQNGGTEGSERAVMMALKWLAEHQLPDGGWSFNHQLGPGNRTSPNPGDMADARNGATGLALLPFLGAGNTHLEGKYKDTVARGLTYLINNRKAAGGGYSFVDAGNMYSHGICMIALTEAYAMTHDRQLVDTAQGAINFTIYAQDPVGGGWRYTPRQAGDTSAVGWQLMGLKSGHLANLTIPENTFIGANKFLDGVSEEQGAYYGYVGPGRGPATTAVGLLCRMYLKWEKDRPGIVTGVKFLETTGPSKGEGSRGADMYYNYYATQVMRHYGGKEWESWNGKIRDWLIMQQDTAKGPGEGSWYFEHAWSTHGGRLYCTAMSCMILEVYYRHMPIYGEKATEEEFKL